MTIDEHVTLNLAALAEYLAMWVSKGPYRFFQMYRDCDTAPGGFAAPAFIVSVRVEGYSHDISLACEEMRNKEHVMRQVAFAVGAVQCQYEQHGIRTQISDAKRKASGLGLLSRM